MGAVRCTIHGHQLAGLMACRHISADIWGVVPVREFQVFRADLFGEATVVMDLALCADCTSRFGPFANGEVDTKLCEQIDPLPVCPVCWHDVARSSRQT